MLLVRYVSAELGVGVLDWMHFVTSSADPRLSPVNNLGWHELVHVPAGTGLGDGL